MLRVYGKSISLGSEHMYESLPRLLTLWHEHAAFIFSGSAAAEAAERAQQGEVKALMRSLARSVPLHVWLCALPQLTSRICHADAEVAALTREMLTRLTQAYPHQALWALAAVSKSGVPARRAAAAGIVQAARRAATGEAERRVFAEMGPFCEQLIRLCFHQSRQRISAKKEFSHLVRTFPLHVLMPTMTALSVTLPPAQGAGAAATQSSQAAPPAWRPFAEPVTIAGMEDGVEVLRSLQVPKKVTLIGSDGAAYAFLAKPKDDLRKDSRMMEAAGVLNRLFAGDPRSRRRGLALRRFAVLPLTEDCGLVEWVPHTVGLRHCVQDVYAAEGLFDPATTNAAIKALYDAAAGQRRKADLLQAVLERFPPRLHRWLLNKFPEPSAWLNARLRFARGAAVWSVTGHVVGLGDRHGENILLDQASGDVVHVDFSCLFDKGLTLEKPEVVPFR